MRVLVVDDDPVILELLQLNLELEGHEVASARDGNEALASARSGAYDLLLLDVMMPQLDGFAVCRQLRADPATANLPVVLLSARTQDTDMAQGTTAGADAYVTKPFDPLDLVRLLERVHGERTHRGRPRGNEAGGEPSNGDDTSR
jgi:DNA-binding response OmpR family regulator